MRFPVRAGPWYAWGMEDEELTLAFHEIGDHFRAGDLDGAETALVALLPKVRGVPEQEIRALQNLTSVFSRCGRMIESLVLATYIVDLARGVGDALGEAKGLSARCIGRYGLFVEADIAEDLRRLEEVLEGFPFDGRTHGLHMELQYASFGHALEQGDLDAAAASLERFRELSAIPGQEVKLAECVYLGSQAHLALARGRPAEALTHLDALARADVAEVHHGPELSVLRVRARAAAGELETARVEAEAAIETLASAPEASLSDVIHYGGQLADVLTGALEDPASARRVYDIVATATFRRIRQLDRCAERLPELGLRGNRDADLVRYRKAFVLRQHELTQRVGAMFRASDAQRLRELLHVPSDGEFIPICAWCESVRTDDGRWIGVGHLVPRAEPFDITHGLCPSCRVAAFAELPPLEGDA